MGTQIRKDEMRIRAAEEHEYPLLVELWRRSVEATHDFLAARDLERIYRQMSHSYLPGVREIWLIETNCGKAWQIRGFMGCNGSHVEMLFVEPELFGQGLGSALLRHARARFGALTLDVNEQNAAALAFYRREGFVITGRSPLDPQGRPYPLLHLAWRPGKGRVAD